MMLNEAQHPMTRTVLQRNLFLFVLSFLFLTPRPIQAIGNVKVGASRLAYSQEVAQSSAANVPGSVYVENVLDLPVVQQPLDSPYFVSDRDGEATQFSMASQYGNLGLLAHNNLAGRDFSRLAVGQEVRLTYADGRTEYFVVKQILRFQALEPESVSSSFRNLEGNETLSAAEMFNRVYVGESRLVFQTCIEAQGNPSWGRLFVVAAPREE